MSLPIDTYSERLHLRTLTLDDVSEEYLCWMNDAEVNQYLESRFVRHTAESLTEFVTAISDDDSYVFAAIVERISGHHIGNIKLGPIDAYHGTGDIGLLIGERSCWGRGYAAEAIGLLADHAFGVLGLDKLTASAYASNVGSVRAFLKAGFEVEGRRTSQFRLGDGREDAVMLGRVRSSVHNDPARRGGDRTRAV